MQSTVLRIVAARLRAFVSVERMRAGLTLGGAASVSVGSPAANAHASKKAQRLRIHTARRLAEVLTERV